MECLFCKIVNKEISSSVVFEDDSVLVFKDINPKAKIHLLIIPKEHIDSVDSEGSEKVIAELIKIAKETGKSLNGYRLVFNVGREAGQTINHLHLHLLSGGLTGEV